MRPTWRSRIFELRFYRAAFYYDIGDLVDPFDRMSMCGFGIFAYRVNLLHWGGLGSVG